MLRGYVLIEKQKQQTQPKSIIENLSNGPTGIIVDIKGRIATVRWDRTRKKSDVPLCELKKV